MDKLAQSGYGEVAWQIAYRMKPEGSILTDRDTPFRLINNTWKYWTADPMVFSYNGNIYLFAELYSYNLKRGVIGCCEWKKNHWSHWKVIIKQTYHMSFPYVFLWENEIYLIPETSETKTVELYKADKFPYKWKKIKTILKNVTLTDTIVINNKNNSLDVLTTEFVDGKMLDIYLSFDSQFNVMKKEVWHSEKDNNTGGGDWRNGGRLVNISNNDTEYIYRVTQNCRNGYGKGLIFTLFDDAIATAKDCIMLFPDDFEIDTVKKISGIHTYTAIDNMEVIDICIRHFSVISFVKRVKDKILRELKKI